MSDLNEAIAEVKRVTPANYKWKGRDLSVYESNNLAEPIDHAIATIMNAVVSGELIHKAEIERGLSDPTAVHYSMLRGTIAKPSVAQIVHLYPDLIPHADALAMAAEAKADVSALMDAGTRALALLRADGRGDTDIAMSLANALAKEIIE